MDRDNFRNERKCSNLQSQIDGVDALLMGIEQGDTYHSRHHAIAAIAKSIAVRTDFKTPAECFNFAEAFVAYEENLYGISLAKRRKAFAKELAEELEKPTIPSELNPPASEKPEALHISHRTMTRRINDSGSV